MQKRNKNLLTIEHFGEELENNMTAMNKQPPDWSNLASVCTDGAPNMRGKEKGLIGLMRQRIFPDCFIVSFIRKTELLNVM